MIDNRFQTPKHGFFNFNHKPGRATQPLRPFTPSPCNLATQHPARLSRRHPTRTRPPKAHQPASQRTMHFLPRRPNALGQRPRIARCPASPLPRPALRQPRGEMRTPREPSARAGQSVGTGLGEGVHQSRIARTRSTFIGSVGRWVGVGWARNERGGKRGCVRW